MTGCGKLACLHSQALAFDFDFDFGGKDRPQRAGFIRPGYPEYPINPAKKAKYRAAVSRYRAAVSRYRAAVSRSTLFFSSILIPKSDKPALSSLMRVRAFRICFELGLSP